MLYICIRVVWCVFGELDFVVLSLLMIMFLKVKLMVVVFSCISWNFIFGLGYCICGELIFVCDVRQGDREIWGKSWVMEVDNE